MQTLKVKYIHVVAKQAMDILNLRFDILEVLDMVPTKEWWGQMLMASSFNVEKWLKIFQMDDISEIGIKEKIEEIELGCNGLKLKEPDFYANYCKNEIDILTNEVLPPDNGLYRFLKGKKKDRHSLKDFWIFYCFKFYLDIRHKSYESRKLKKLMEDDCTFETLSAISTETVNRSHLDASLISEEFQYFVKNLHTFIHSQFKEKQLDSQMTNALMDNFVKVRNLFPVFMAELYVLFCCLNTCMINEKAKDSIYEILSKSSLHRNIQDIHDYFCKQCPDIVKRVNFYESAELIALDKVKWSSVRNRDSSCFQCSMTKAIIISLYKALLQKYISHKTDILDFTHIFTGLPIEGKTGVTPIDWVHKEKQGLALFIGLIKEHDTKKTTWIEASRLFRLNGKEVSLKSTQYTQARESKKYDSLVRVINDIFAK